VIKYLSITCVLLVSACASQNEKYCANSIVFYDEKLNIMHEQCLDEVKYEQRDFSHR
jgi:thiaminase